MAVRIEDAGFEIRDQIMWIYGSGFPKSHNIGHKVEDMQGWGTALKPAHEPIVMARKPFSGTVADNVLEWGTGGINIDGCRIGVNSNDTNHRSIDNKNVHTTNFANNGNPRPDKIPEQESQLNSKGRFPANVILDKEAGKVLDEQSGTSKSTGGRIGNKEGAYGGIGVTGFTTEH
jgi:site-specific DNA-methyltransferase (adenine-specific)